MNKINWKLFAGSSHCAEGIADFALGNIKTFKDFECYFLPYMEPQANEVRKMKISRLGISTFRKRAARAFRRQNGLSITEAYE